MNTRDRNINVWSGIYNQAAGMMSYPNENLVRISHRLLDVEKHSKLLEYGFGSGADFLHFCSKGFKVTGVEISQSAIDQLNEKLNTLSIDSDLYLISDGKLPFPDESFDAVVAWQVLYYNDWSGFRIAMQEINRVLRKGGIFLGTMGAIGDFSHTHSRSLGDSLYESTVPGQEGAVVIILDEDQLQDCFPGERLRTGHYSHSFGDRHGKHWVVSYEKGSV